MLKFILCLLPALTILAHADMAMRAVAERRAHVPMYPIKLTEARGHLLKLQQQRPLTSAESDLQQLLMVAQLLKIGELTAGTPDASGLLPESVRDTISNKALERASWENRLSADERQMLPQIVPVIQRFYTESSLEWAWVLKQQGRIAEAKKKLQALFQTEYDHTMKLRAIYHDSPLSRAIAIEQALAPLSSVKERAQLSAQLQQLRTHISNLPDAMIMT